MPKQTTTYNVYAGYYEIYVTTQTLRRPFTLQSTHRKLSAALRAADRYDVSVIYDSALRDDVAASYDMEPEQLEWMHFFDGSKESIDNGLTEVTLDNLSRALDTKPCAADLTDMANLKALREKISIKKASALISGLTYAQLKPLFP